MTSGVGTGTPAGDSGKAGRGTVGTVAPTEPKRHRLREALIQEIGKDHPNALSRLDRLDGVGGRR